MDEVRVGNAVYGKFSTTKVTRIANFAAAQTSWRRRLERQWTASCLELLRRRITHNSAFKSRKTMGENHLLFKTVLRETGLTMKKYILEENGGLTNDLVDEVATWPRKGGKERREWITWTSEGFISGRTKNAGRCRRI